MRFGFERHNVHPSPTQPTPTDAAIAGVVLPLLQQSVMFFNLGLSRFVLKKELKWEQIAGACLVVAGVIAAAWPSETGGSVFAQVRVCPAVTSLQALDSILAQSGQILTLTRTST